MSGEVYFSATPQDWIAANRLWYRRARSRMVLTSLGAVAIASGAMLVALDLVLFNKQLVIAVSDGLPIILFGAIVAGMPLLTLWLIPRQVRRQFSQRPSMADGTHSTWSDTGLTFSTRTGTTVQPWGELHRQLRDDRSFVFLLTDRMLLLIPRRALTHEQAADLAATADQNGPALR